MAEPDRPSGGQSDWFPAKRSCSDTLARCGAKPKRRQAPFDPTREAVRLVDWVVGRFMGDPHVEWMLSKVYGPLEMPVPPIPQGTPTMWVKVMKSVYGWFRSELGQIRPVDDAEDRPTSYALSHAALRQCARVGKHLEFSYVFSACKRRHLRQLKWERRWRFGALDAEMRPVAGGETWGEVDLRLDLDDALARFGDEDARIGRLRLVEGYTLAEIGKELGLHESTVQRRFERKILPVLRQTLAAYSPCQARDTVVAAVEPLDAGVGKAA